MAARSDAPVRAAALEQDVVGASGARAAARGRGRSPRTTRRGGRGGGHPASSTRPTWSPRIGMRTEGPAVAPSSHAMSKWSAYRLAGPSSRTSHHQRLALPARAMWLGTVSSDHRQAAARRGRRPAGRSRCGAAELVVQPAVVDDVVAVGAAGVRPAGSASSRGGSPESGQVRRQGSRVVEREAAVQLHPVGRGGPRGRTRLRCRCDGDPPGWAEARVPRPALVTPTGADQPRAISRPRRSPHGRTSPADRRRASPSPSPSATGALGQASTGAQVLDAVELALELAAARAR